MNKRKDPLISIITPCYKGEEYLPGMVASVMSQSFKDFELLLIDDASPDATREVMQSEVKKYKAESRMVLLRNEKNLGIVGTRNKALSSAKGKYICFLDQDDVWIDPEKLALQVAYFHSHPECAVVGSHAQVIDQAGKEFGALIYACSDEDIRSKLLCRNQFMTCSVMMRKEVLEKTGLLDSKYDKVDDYDLWLRAGNYGKFHNIDKKLVAYRKSGNNTSAANATFLKMKKLHLKLVWREFWNYPNAMFALLFCAFNSFIPYGLAEKLRKTWFKITVSN